MKDVFSFRDKCVIALHRAISLFGGSSKLPFGISFLIVTKDNQDTIRQVVKSIECVADEIIIVDGNIIPTVFSSNKIRVIHYFTAEKCWGNFVDSLNMGLILCRFRWVFKWDADMVGDSAGLAIWREKLRELKGFCEVDVARLFASKSLYFGGYEARLFTQSPKLRYKLCGADVLIFPLKYRLLRWNDKFITHLDPK